MQAVNAKKGGASAFDMSRVLKKMRLAKDEVIDNEKVAEDTSVQSIVTDVHERLRTLQNERENDRTFLNKKFKDLETTLTAASHQAAASGGGGAVAGLALDKLHETIHVLQESNTLLTQQNQRILTVLDQVNSQQVQLSLQIQTQQQQMLALQQQQERGRGGERDRSMSGAVPTNLNTSRDRSQSGVTARDRSQSGVTARDRGLTGLTGVVRYDEGAFGDGGEASGSGGEGSIIPGGDN